MNEIAKKQTRNQVSRTSTAAQTGFINMSILRSLRDGARPTEEHQQRMIEV